MRGRSAGTWLACTLCVLALVGGRAGADGPEAGPDDLLWPQALKALHDLYLAEQKALQEVPTQQRDATIAALREQRRLQRLEVLRDLQAGTRLSVAEPDEGEPGGFRRLEPTEEQREGRPAPVILARRARLRLAVELPAAYARLVTSERRGPGGNVLPKVPDLPQAWDLSLTADGEHVIEVRHGLAAYESLPSLGVEWVSQVRVRLDSTPPPISFVGLVDGVLLRRQEDAREVAVRSEPGARVWWEHEGPQSAVVADAAGMLLLPAVGAGEHRVLAVDRMGNTPASPASVTVVLDRENPVIESLRIFQQGAKGWTAEAFVSDDVECRGSVESSVARVEARLHPRGRTVSIDLSSGPGTLLVRDAVGRQADVAFQAPPSATQVGVTTLRVEPVAGLPEARLEVVGGRGGEVLGDASAGWTIDLSGLGQEARTARLSGRLRGTIRVEWEIHLFLDDSEPTIESVAPAPGSLLEQAPARLKVVVGKEVVQVRFVMGERVVSATPTSGVATLELAGLPKAALMAEGGVLEALDRLGRSARQPLAWTLSTLPASARDAVPWPEDDRPRVDLRGKKKEQWFLVRIPEAGSWAFEANARRAGQAMKVRLEIWETGPTGRMLDSNDGREGRWKGDPRINTMLDAGTYLVRARALSGQGWFQIAREMQR